MWSRPSPRNEALSALSFAAVSSESLPIPACVLAPRPPRRPLSHKHHLIKELDRPVPSADDPGVSQQGVLIDTKLDSPVKLRGDGDRSNDEIQVNIRKSARHAGLVKQTGETRRLGEGLAGTDDRDGIPTSQAGATSKSASPRLVGQNGMHLDSLFPAFWAAKTNVMTQAEHIARPSYKGLATSTANRRHAT